MKPNKIVPLPPHHQLGHPQGEAAVEVVMRPTHPPQAGYPIPQSTGADSPWAIWGAMLLAVAIGLLAWNHSNAARADRAESAAHAAQMEAAQLSTQIDSIQRVVCPPGGTDGQ